MMKLISLVFLLIASAMSGLAQTYPTKTEIKVALKDVDYVFRRFGELSDRIDFELWNTYFSSPYLDAKGMPFAARERIQATRENIEANQKDIYDCRIWIARLESNKVSSIALLRIYETLSATAEITDSLAHDAERYQNNIELAIDFTKTSTAATLARLKFRPILVKYLEAQELELRISGRLRGKK